MVRVESLDQDGQGVARVNGKVTFIEGALPGETVEIEIRRRKPRFDLASARRIVAPSSMRVAARCPYFERCGGCSLQHLEPRAQVAVKQRVLEDHLLHIGRVRAETMLAPIHGPVWGYRNRARLAVRLVPARRGVLVGFHERHTHRVADMGSCEVLPPRVSALIAPLRALLSGLDLAARIPQVEVCVGEGPEVLALRVLDPPGEADLARLRRFAAQHGVQIYLQPGGAESLRPMDGPAERALAYRLPDFGLELRFSPADFTQVNHAVNRVLVRRAVALLAPQPGERIGDMFCGLGNFALALARRGARVVGVEGSPELVARAAENARLNGLAQRVQFRTADLDAKAGDTLRDLLRLDKMLIDPPRDGAHALVRAIDERVPRRVVYISCNPATLARDARILVLEKGYRFAAAGVVNMFPHTSHVESIALFERE
jgi:23S rRNA (uracil1939-C5)-methyltransferase